VGCRETLDKRSLIRIVRTPEGPQVDPTGKAQGRGAYVHDQASCWEAALKGGLARALKIELSPAERDRLLASLEALSGESHG
jgi:predicted RNA-binding protein YlxR (DUF448 family)